MSRALVYFAEKCQSLKETAHYTVVMLPKLIPWYEQKMFIVYKESDESLSQRFWDPNMLFEVR